MKTKTLANYTEIRLQFSVKSLKLGRSFESEQRLEKRQYCACQITQVWLDK